MSAETIYARLAESWETCARDAALESVEDYAATLEEKHFDAAKIADSLTEDVATLRRVLGEMMTANPDLAELDEISDFLDDIDRQASDLTIELERDLSDQRARFVAAVDTLSRGAQR